MKKDLPIVEENLKENSIIGKEQRKEINIEEKSTVEENSKTELIDKSNLEENIQKETTLRIKEASLSKNCDLQEQFSSDSEDSESDYEVASTRLLSKKMNQKKYYANKNKQRPGQNLIDKVLKGQYSKMNRIFDEPAKAVPLPRKSGTINITFSERAFPTPARESSQVKEQEVCFIYISGLGSNSLFVTKLQL